MPSIMPTAAGSQLMRPIGSDSSNDGMMSDHTEAATITPAAKPNSALLSCEATLWRAKSTAEAPSTVPRNGMMSIARLFIGYGV